MIRSQKHPESVFNSVLFFPDAVIIKICSKHNNQNY